MDVRNEPPAPPAPDRPYPNERVASREPLLVVANARDLELDRLTYEFRVATDPEIAVLAASAAEVLLEADRVAKALKGAPATVPGLVAAYAEGEHPWCLLDTHHRHLEGRWYNFESEPGDDHPDLEKLILKEAASGNW